MSDSKHYVNRKGVELRSIDIHGSLHCFDTTLESCPDDRTVYEEMGVLQYDGYEADSPIYDVFDVIRHAPDIIRKINCAKLREVLPMEGEGEAEFDFLGLKATGWIAKSKSGDYPVIYISTKLDVFKTIMVITDTLNSIGAAARWSMNSFEISQEDFDREVKADAHLYACVAGYDASTPSFPGGMLGSFMTLLEIELVLN